MTLDDNTFGCGIGGKGDLGVDVDVIAISEVNGFQQLGVADDAADFNLVLQREIALIDNAKRGQLICTAGLPKNLRACIGNRAVHLELQCFALGGYPVCSVIHFQSNIKRTCLNLVHSR